MLKTSRLPPTVHSAFVDLQVMETMTLDERSMLAFVDHVLDEPCTAPNGDRLAWDELRMDHTWARVPEPDRHLDQGELRIDDYDCHARRVLVPLERAHGHMWATVPEMSVWYPFHLQVAKNFGTTYPDGPEYDEFITMYISVNWSFWSHGEGKAMLDQALNRLFRQGWREADPDPGTSRQ